jgi:hypothetical protein
MKCCVDILLVEERVDSQLDNDELLAVPTFCTAETTRCSDALHLMMSFSPMCHLLHPVRLIGGILSLVKTYSQDHVTTVEPTKSFQYS